MCLAIVRVCVYECSDCVSGELECVYIIIYVGVVLERRITRSPF